MREYALAVHWRILDLSFVVATVRKDDKGLVIVSFSVFELSFIVSVVSEDRNSKAIWQFVFIEIALVVGALGGNVEEWFALNV
jgi:hypothetical protein